MKNLIIIITKSTVLDDVSLNSAYAGAKSNDGKASFDKVAVIEQDEAMLSRFWTEMCGKITDKLKEFVAVSSLTSDKFSLTLELSGAYDESMSQSVVEDLKAALATGVTARWFRYTLSDRAEEWDAQSTRLLDSALSKLCHRSKPVRSNSPTL